MKKMNKLICLLFLSLLLAGCGRNSVNMVETPANMKMQRGRNYREVIEDFQDKGFTNIKLRKIEDLKYGFVVRYEQVETISVGGDTNYDTGVKVPADTEVVISYHSYQTGSEEETEGGKTENSPAEKPARDQGTQPAGNQTGNQTGIQKNDPETTRNLKPAENQGTKPAEDQAAEPVEKQKEAPGPAAAEKAQ